MFMVQVEHGNFYHFIYHIPHIHLVESPHEFTQHIQLNKNLLIIIMAH
jgi:hypothetical protein